MSDALDRLAAHAEVLKLARVLGEDPDRFGFLLDVPAADIRLLRAQVTDALHGAHLPVLRRLAGASRLLPAPVLAGLAQQAFGPLLSARIAGLVDPGRGADIAGRLSPGFLADVAAELDPERAVDVITRLPAATVTAVSDELRRREDWITLGRFVGSVPAGIAAAGLDVLGEPDVLRVAFVLDGTATADVLLSRVPEERYPRLVLAADEHDLWHALFGLLARLRPDARQRVVTAARGLDSGLLGRAAEKAREFGVLDELPPLRQVLLG